MIDFNDLDGAEENGDDEQKAWLATSNKDWANKRAEQKRKEAKAERNKQYPTRNKEKRDAELKKSAAYESLLAAENEERWRQAEEMQKRGQKEERAKRPQEFAQQRERTQEPKKEEAANAASRSVERSTNSLESSTPAVQPVSRAWEATELPAPRAAPLDVHGADFYALDNALLRSKSTGIHLRRAPTILENDLSTPLIKWGTIIRGVNYVPDAEANLDAKAADEAVKEAEMSIRDIYDRSIPIVQEPREWLEVKGITNLRGKIDGVTKRWYIPFDITNVPILLKKDGMTSDDEDSEQDDRPANYDDVREPTDSPPFPLGRGMMYEVVYDSVVVRAAPSLAARAQSRETKGAIVEMFDWDETLKWRAVHDRLHRVGWMLLDHPELGALLRPRCLPFQVRPVEPLVAAVLEEDVRWLRQFINKGMDVNTKDAGARTPLMVAAEFGCHGPMVVLRAAGANASLENANGKTAMELVRTEATRALLRALTEKQFNAESCQEALDGLEGDVRELADDLLGKKLLAAKFLQRPDHDMKPKLGEAAKKPEPGPMQRRPKPAPAGLSNPDEEETQPVVDVEALAVRGKCALCLNEFRQAIMAKCCVALFCSDCVLSRLAGEGSEEGCPGCGAEIPTTGLDFLRPEEASKAVDERLRERKRSALEAAREDRRQAEATR